MEDWYSRTHVIYPDDEKILDEIEKRLGIDLSKQHQSTILALKIAIVCLEMRWSKTSYQVAILRSHKLARAGIHRTWLAVNVAFHTQSQENLGYLTVDGLTYNGYAD